MLDPKLILSKYVLAAKLASFPINSFFIPAAISSYMLVAILQIQSYSTLTALRKSVGLLAFIEKVVRELPDIDVPVTLITIDQHLAVIDIMLALILVLL